MIGRGKEGETHGLEETFLEVGDDDELYVLDCAMLRVGSYERYTESFLSSLLKGGPGSRAPMAVVKTATVASREREKFMVLEVWCNGEYACCVGFQDWFYCSSFSFIRIELQDISRRPPPSCRAATTCSLLCQLY